MRLHSMDFPDGQSDAIQQEAKRQGIAAAYLIRRVMDIYLDQAFSHNSLPVSSEKLPPQESGKAATETAGIDFPQTTVALFGAAGGVTVKIGAVVGVFESAWQCSSNE